LKLSTLLSTIATAVANNAALETYCQTKWGKSVSIFVHINPKSPPSISNAPAVGLTVQGYSRPTENNNVMVEFELETAAYISDATAATSGKITTLGGFAVLEDFSDLVFAAIEAAAVTSSTQLNTTYKTEQGTTMTISEYPGWVASRTWTISKHV
jgi:hypothetical protein